MNIRWRLLRCFELFGRDGVNRVQVRRGSFIKKLVLLFTGATRQGPLDYPTLMFVKWTGRYGRLGWSLLTMWSRRYHHTADWSTTVLVWPYYNCWKCKHWSVINRCNLQGWRVRGEDSSVNAAQAKTTLQCWELRPQVNLFIFFTSGNLALQVNSGPLTLGHWVSFRWSENDYWVLIYIMSGVNQRNVHS